MMKKKETKKEIKVDSAGNLPEDNPEDPNKPEEDEVVSFTEMGLDDRILLSLIELNWTEPTPIQEAAIPLVLAGRDILAKARTGSGKTGAYALPLIQKILTIKKRNYQDSSKSSLVQTRALIITPSRELCSQAARNINELTRFCQRDVTMIDLSTTQLNFQAQRQCLLTRPDIVVATPAKILAHLKDTSMKPAVDFRTSLELLVIDEADLLLSFGYEDEIKSLVNYLPRNLQTILLSATLNEEVETIKSLYLHNPAVLKLKTSAELPDPIQLEQYQIKCDTEEDKYVLLYSIMKLQLIQGKSLIFVNTVNRCYKLKLFLENFGIRSCVLNSELPINSRMHIIEQFNGGIYDTIIASDEKFVDPTEDSSGKPNQQENDKTKSKKKKDKEYNISRGIDFRHVTNVINFDFPSNTKSYIHRVGRTARGNQRGTALSLVEPNEATLLELVDEELKESYNYESTASIFKPFRFKMDEIEGFRYRARDVLRSITTVVVKEARIKEIKMELLNSEKLKSYFEENPREAEILRHDKQLNSARLDEHLKNVPQYIIPESLRGIQLKGGKTSTSKQRNKMKKRLTNTQKKFHKKSLDPLKNFGFVGLKKTKK